MRGSDETDWLSVNLAVLAKTQPELAQFLSGSEAAALEHAVAKNGSLTARREGRWLHSPRDPAGEAARVLAAAFVPGSDTVIVLGAGLGWTIEAALARLGIERVLVCEAEASMLSAMLASRDLRSPLADPRLSWMVGGDPGALMAALTDCGAKLVTLLRLASLEAFDADWYRRLRGAFERWLSKEEINVNTLRRFGRLWIGNLTRNAASFPGFPGIEGLDGAFEGIPALVVAAGPSLDDLLPFLGELRRRCLLIAVDTALRSLLLAGCEPDFLVIVDPQYWNWRHIADLEAPSTLLVSEPAVFPPALRRAHPAIFLAESLFPLGRALAGTGRGALGAGGSVATSAWDLARRLGASTIYMAGLDLGYPHGHTHAKASLFEQRALTSASRLAPAATSQAAALFGAPGEWVAANDGGRIYSDQRMALYAWWFEARLARREGAATKSLSASGRAIPGMALATFDELLSLPPRRSAIDDGLRQLHAIQVPADSAARLAETLEALSRGLGGIADSASRGLAAAQSGRQALSRGEAPTEALALLSEVDAELGANAVRDIAGFLLPPLRDLFGTQASTLTDSLAQSESLYTAIGASASTQLALLEETRLALNEEGRLALNEGQPAASPKPMGGQNVMLNRGDGATFGAGISGPSHRSAGQESASFRAEKPQFSPGDSEN